MNKTMNRKNELLRCGIDTKKHFSIDLESMRAGEKISIAFDGSGYTVSTDAIATDIMNGGYVFNSRVDGRFITARTFQMLNKGYAEALNKDYAFSYQFSMMLDELDRLIAMKKSNDGDYDALSKFFTKDVIVSTCKDAFKKIQKHIKDEYTGALKAEYARRGKGLEPRSVELSFATAGKILKISSTSDMYENKTYVLLNNYISIMKNCDCADLVAIKGLLKDFVYSMPKLPSDTPKSPAWKDAFKGRGGYTTLLNIIKFHDVRIIIDEETLGLIESVNYVETLLIDDNYFEPWRFHKLLKETIASNNFVLKF